MAPDGLAVEFSNALMFPSGEAELKPSGVEAFAPIQAYLVETLGPQYGMVIEGYTDDVPISNARFRSNWELSTSRAIHVMERLIGAGLDARRISVKGYANTRPATEIDIADPQALSALDAPTLEQTRAANRRVIIRIDALDSEVLRRLGPLPEGTPRPPEATPENLAPLTFPVAEPAPSPVNP